MWKPLPSSQWSCLPVCGHLWNTFDTAGVCPQCDEHFEHTQCLRCLQFSPHRQWYHDADPSEKKLEQHAAEG
jgi:hypothetical protein